MSNEVYGSVKFLNGSVLENAIIERATEKALEAIKNELPTEAHIYEVFFI